MAARELNVIPGPLALPTIDSEPAERADAARNRRRILVAAERLFDAQGVEAVSMDAIACEAGVGKGTLFRRFGDRAGLVMALLDERTKEFQDALIRGEPPLGPGAPPVERLLAFGAGLLALLDSHARFILAGDKVVTGRYGHPVYALYRTHVALLLREILGEGTRTEYLVEALLAPLAPEPFIYQREDLGMSLQEMTDGWKALADAVVSTAGG
jgi:AcrR family transcriptional regulator